VQHEKVRGQEHRRVSTSAGRHELLAAVL
jgi:hypothetical protein